MATEAERLYITLEARLDKYTRDLNQAQAMTNARLTGIERRYAAFSAQVKASTSGALANMKSLLLLGGTGFGVAGLKHFIDSAIRTENALRVAGLEGENLTRVYDALYESAQRNGAPFETLAQLYGRIGLAQKELGVSTQEMINFTDNVAVALRVSGRSSAEARGALIQLAQAMGGGVVRAEEFNAILEGALPIAQAAAAGLEEAGGSVAKLRKLIIDGKVPSDAFFRAFEAGSYILQGKAAAATFTLGQGIEQLSNSLIKAVGQIDEATGTSRALGGALAGLGANVGELGDYFERNGPRVSSFFDMLRGHFAALEDNKNAFRNALGLDAIDDFLAGTSLIEGRFGRLSTQIEEQRRNMLSLGLAGSPAPPDGVSFKGEAYGPKPMYGPFLPPKKVSLKDFDPPDTPGNGTEKRSQFEREIDDIAKRTAALRAEISTVDQSTVAQERAKAAAELRAAAAATAAKEGRKVTAEELATIERLASAYGAVQAEAQFLAKVQSEKDRTRDLQNEVALIGLEGQALEQARIKQELLNAAREAGVNLTEQQRAEIDVIAGRNAAVLQTRDALLELRSTSQDVLKGYISDVREGASATEALGNALDRLADKLFDMAANSLVESALGGLMGGVGGGAGGGSTLTGWATSILPTFARGGISNGPAIFGEAGTEAAVPLPDGRRIPVDLRLPEVPKASAAPAGNTVNMQLSIDARGATAEGAAALKSELVPTIQKVVRNELNQAFDRSSRFSRTGI